MRSWDQVCGSVLHLVSLWHLLHCAYEQKQVVGVGVVVVVGSVLPMFFLPSVLFAVYLICFPVIFWSCCVDHACGFEHSCDVVNFCLRLELSLRFSASWCEAVLHCRRLLVPGC